MTDLVAPPEVAMDEAVNRADREPAGALPWSYKDRKLGVGGERHYVLRDANGRYLGQLVSEELAQWVCRAVNNRDDAIEALETGIGMATGIKLLIGDDVAGKLDAGLHVKHEAVRAMRTAAGDAMAAMIQARDALGSGRPKRNGHREASS